jgi:predicted MPP superfamily phosphohydrolase
VSYLKLLPALTVMCSVGGGAAAYCAHRLTEPLGLGALQLQLVLVVAGVFGLLLAACFLLTPLSGQKGVNRLQVVGFVAFGFVSVLLAGVASWDALRLLSGGLRLVLGPSDWLLPWSLEGSSLHFWIAHVVLGGALFATVWSLLNALRPACLSEVDVEVAGLPDALRGFTILQLSDIHIGPGIGHSRLSQIVAQCADYEVDLIAVTGDLADGDALRLRADSEPLSRLSARHGVWFVTGNHDYYSGVDPWCARASELGMEVLLNDSRVVEQGGARLLVAGVTDRSGGMFVKDHHPQLERARGTASVDFSLLLAHQPNCAPAAAALGFDLQLSGHTHGGQYFPFTLFIHGVQRYVAGLYRVGKMALYVHRGTTWWGPPMRLGSRHEIALIRLKAA